MGRVILRRVGLAIPILWGVTVIVFLLMTVTPGSPESTLVARDATTAERQVIRDELGLDDPLPVQYLNWAANLLQGDLGYSLQRRLPVADLLAQAWVNTAILAGVSAVVGITTGLAFGYLAGVRRGTVVDRVVSFLSFGGLSIPDFFLAVLLLAVFAGGLKILPSGGADFSDPVTAIESLVLPVMAGSMIAMAITARVTRAAVVDAMSADFVQTLRAKGLTEFGVRRHVFRNALSPVLTISGVQIGALLGGSVLVETIFRWPGLGLLLYKAITARDLVVVQGVTLIIAVTFVVINLIVDLVQAAIDPRVRGAVT